jgi:hypothetical protein
MATKKREENGDTTIRFDSTDMLRIEKLLEILEHDGGTIYVGPEESKWLSSARELFYRELPDGRYSI